MEEQEGRGEDPPGERQGPRLPTAGPVGETSRSPAMPRSAEGALMKLSAV